MTVFLGEICGEPNAVLFADLRERLIRRLRYEIRAGSLTERALARRAGLSQPHVHNLLKGIRSPTAESADSMLGAISRSVLDLLDPSEAETTGTPRPGPAVMVPLLRCTAGPGGKWDAESNDVEHVQVPCNLLAGIAQPAVVRVLADDEMSGILGRAVIDLRVQTGRPFAAGDLYLLFRSGQARLRYIRAGRDRFYFPSLANLNRPCDWQSAPRNADLAGIIRARVSCVLGNYGPAAACL
jgi:hypothetical protein